MSKEQQITGVVSYHSFGTGFWGITDTSGHEWRPVHMPDQLKVQGASVICKIRIIEEDTSIFMWGRPVEIVSFHTPSPGKA